jgi:hypothetical protein
MRAVRPVAACNPDTTQKDAPFVCKLLATILTGCEPQIRPRLSANYPTNPHSRLLKLVADVSRCTHLNSVEGFGQ